jgi:hypothetical protein
VGLLGESERTEHNHDGERNVFHFQKTPGHAGSTVPLLRIRPRAQHSFRLGQDQMGAPGTDCIGKVLLFARYRSVGR